DLVAGGEAEQVEGLALQRGGAGDHGECRRVVGGLDVVGADGGQVGEQAGEAVYRDAVLGAFARGFGERLVGALGRGDGVGAFGGCAGFVVVVEQDGGQGLFHVPADVVGQHPQEHVGAHPIGEVVADGPHVEFAVEGAEEPLDVFESLVAQHHIVVGEGVGGQAGAQHVDAVEGGLGGDGVLVAAEGERVLGDGDGEVLGHLERVDYLAGPQPDGVLAAQRLTLTAGGRSDLVALGFGGGQQLAAFAGAFGGQGGVAAADQPLPGVVRVGDGHQ